MNFDTFLTSPRWEILQIIAEKPTSPVEISKKLNVTVSYASQQLKLLDAAGLTKTQKTGAAERGKPRTLFSLSKEFFYLTVLSEGLSYKKYIELDLHHKAILNIWSFTNPDLHYSLERVFWKLQDNLKEIKGIFLEKKKNQLIIISDSKSLKLKLDSFIKNFEKKIEFSIISKPLFDRLNKENLCLLYGDEIIDELKGGIEKQ